MEQLPHNARFRINAPRISHQTIDGESIIIDFDNGSYFSTIGVGAMIWESIDQNAAVDAIVHQVTQHYTGDATLIQRAVEQFLLDLQRESLIVPSENIPDTLLTEPPVAQPNLTEPAAFQTPSLDKYTDMQDLLLLDPIHDVDEQGWPMKKETGSK